jgi:hypothetical protein
MMLRDPERIRTGTANYFPINVIKQKKQQFYVLLFCFLTCFACPCCLPIAIAARSGDLAEHHGFSGSLRRAGNLAEHNGFSGSLRRAGSFGSGAFILKSNLQKQLS